MLLEFLSDKEIQKRFDVLKEANRIVRGLEKHAPGSTAREKINGWFSGSKKQLLSLLFLRENPDYPGIYHDIATVDSASGETEPIHREPPKKIDFYNGCPYQTDEGLYYNAADVDEYLRYINLCLLPEKIKNPNLISNS